MAPKKPHVGGSTGFRFETKMTAFTALRLIQTSEDFFLDSNNNTHSGNLDDIVYAAVGPDRKWCAWFIQIKHRLDRHIRASDLLGDSSKDFAFHTHYPSFSSILRRYEMQDAHPIFGRQIVEKKFVIFTNAPLHVTLHKRRETVPVIFRTSDEPAFKFSSMKDRGLLTKINNEQLFEKFVDSFIFCPNQCKETEMDALILEEIRKIFTGLSILEIKVVTNNWIQFIQEWSATDQLLTKSMAVTQLREFINRVQIGKKKNMNFVQFNSSFSEYWKMNLSNETEQFIHLTVEATNTQLAMALLKQINMTSYPNMEIAIEDLWDDNLPGKVPTGVLVIDCTDFIFCNQEKLISMRKSCKNRVIIVSSHQNQAGQRIAQIFQAKSKLFQCDLTYLTEESRKILLDRKFRFQGHETDVSTVVETELKLINTSMLTQLFSNLPEIGKELPEGIPFYVPRILMRTITVSKGFFNLDTQSRFGLIHADPSLFNNPRIVHLKNESEFDKYVNDDVPFHVFAAQTKNTYTWRKSSKNIQEIAAHLKSDVTVEKRDNVLQINDKVVIISGKPGIGKSTLLHYLATATKKYCPNYWIVTVTLSDFKAHFSRENFNRSDLEEVLNVAAGVDPKNLFHKQLFNYCYRSGKMILLLDGFDEINSVNGLVMLEILNRSPVARLWITTHSINRSRLEKLLNVFAYTIKPFSKPDQKKFLKQFWKLSDDNEKYIDETLELVANSLSEKFENFTGIPLHTRMIAEVFDPKKPRKKTINAVELFQEFIKLKRQAFVGKHKAFMPAYALEMIESDHEEKLTSLALLALLPPETCSKLQPPVVDEEGLKKFVADSSSIVLSYHEIPRFIHRMFAEYYVARYFDQHFPTNRDFLNSDQFFDANFEFVRYFLDRFLAKGCLLHEAAFACDCDAVKRAIAGGENVNAVDRAGRTALHIAAGVPNSVAVILALISAGVDADREDRILGWRAVRYAMKAELQENYAVLIEHTKSLEEANVPVTWIALLHAVRGDYIKTFLHLLDHGLNSVEDLNALTPRKWINENEDSLTILHVAAAYNAKKILKFLLLCDGRDSKQYLIESTDQKGLTALLWAAKSGHTEALQILLNCGADLYKRSNDGKTVAIYAVEKHNTDILLTYLADTRKRNFSPFTCLSDVVVKLIQDKSVWATGTFSYLMATYPELITLNSVLNMSLLSAACVVGNEDVVKKLLDLGADTKQMTRKGSILHLAVIGNHSSVVKLLLENNVPVNIADSQGATPIFCAASRGFAEIFFLLANAGANLNIVTVHGDNLAHAAARSSPQPGICKFLILKGINFYKENNFSETGLSLLKANKALALVNMLEKTFIPSQVTARAVPQVKFIKPQPVPAAVSYVKQDYKNTHWTNKNRKNGPNKPAT